MTKMIFSGSWGEFVAHWQMHGDGLVRWVTKCDAFMPWLKKVQPGKYGLLDMLLEKDPLKWEHWYLVKSVLLIDEEASSIPGADLTMMFTFAMSVIAAFRNPDGNVEALVDFLETSGAYFLEDEGKQHEIHLWRQFMRHPKYYKTLSISDPDDCQWTFFWDPKREGDWISAFHEK